MSKKENFNQAVFDMFGVGKGREKDDDIQRDAISSDAPVEPVVEPVLEMVPQQSAFEIAKPVAQAAVPTVGPTVAPFSVVAATYIAPGTVVEGNIRCKGDVEVAGELHGDIESEGDVTIRSNIKGNISAANLRVIDCRIKGDSKVSGRMNIDVTSVVEGNVDASELVCSGIIRGDSRVLNNITLDASAKVFGNITTDTMSMERGASISGELVMGKHWDNDELFAEKEKKSKKEKTPKDPANE